MIRSQSCIKCLTIIAVIHSMHMSLKQIVDHHNSDSEMLKREMRFLWTYQELRHKAIERCVYMADRPSGG